MGSHEINQFLCFLARKKKVAAYTQNQALNAIFFLYHFVLDMEIEIGDNLFAQRKRNIFQRYSPNKKPTLCLPKKLKGANSVTCPVKFKKNWGNTSPLLSLNEVR